MISYEVDVVNRNGGLTEQFLKLISFTRDLELSTEDILLEEMGECEKMQGFKQSRGASSCSRNNNRWSSIRCPYGRDMMLLRTPHRKCNLHSPAPEIESPTLWPSCESFYRQHLWWLITQSQAQDIFIHLFSIAFNNLGTPPETSLAENKSNEN